MNKPLLSLCIPTYGVIEWVFPVLESIYSQKCDNQLFEVVVTDNGENAEFKKRIKEYLTKHDNMVYAETNALPFVNEIESYSRASGKFIKFINHRTILLPGTLEKLLVFVKSNEGIKPFVYFGNGIIDGIDQEKQYENFDCFISGLSYWSSWSTGMGFWKEDFDKIDKSKEFNELFPHTDILFSCRDKEKYIINNEVLLEELSDDGIPKGKYDLFYAFAVEYPAILLQLLRDGDITLDTFNKVKNDNLVFIMEQYHAYVVRKRECSYILNNYEKSIEVFYGREKALQCYRKLRLNQIKKELACRKEERNG